MREQYSVIALASDEFQSPFSEEITGSQGGGPVYLVVAEREQTASEVMLVCTYWEYPHYRASRVKLSRDKEIDVSKMPSWAHKPLLFFINKVSEAKTVKQVNAFVDAGVLHVETIARLQEWNSEKQIFDAESSTRKRHPDIHLYFVLINTHRLTDVELDTVTDDRGKPVYCLTEETVVFTQNPIFTPTEQDFPTRLGIPGQMNPTYSPSMT